MLLAVAGSVSVSAAAASSTAGKGQPSDLVIAGGTIYDGRSVAGVVGDVAIRGDRIVYVGPAAANPFVETARFTPRGW
jgi:N-acyl-D-amino-acid deacylase